MTADKKQEKVIFEVNTNDETGNTTSANTTTSKSNPDHKMPQVTTHRLIRPKRKKSIWKRMKSISIIRIIYVFITTSLDLVRSIAIRIIFCIHSLIAIILVCFVRNELWYFVNSVGIVFIILEFMTIALKNGGKDLFWFSPSFFLYIATLIPPTWFLELENVNLKLIKIQSIDNASKVLDFDFMEFNQSDIGLGDFNVPVVPGDLKVFLEEIFMIAFFM
jgi:hypothetical protein